MAVVVLPEGGNNSSYGGSSGGGSSGSVDDSSGAGTMTPQGEYQEAVNDERQKKEDVSKKEN